MKWTVNMKVKDYVRNWSDQEIHTEYKGVNIDIKIKDTNCVLVLEGEENVDDVFRLVWELLFLYDGYFYKPVSYEIDGCKKESKDLVILPFYVTDERWNYSELLGRAQRDLSSEVIEKYDRFRNTGIYDKKMTKSVVNAFYYLKSENYAKINVNHRLSLLLNIADGFIINTYKETNNVKASYDRLFKKTVNNQKLQQGVSLLGIEGEKYKGLLAEERTTFDHYIYSENSLVTFVHDSEEEIADYATWYFIYILELTIRINFLKESGVLLEQETVDYALESINDWIIYENDLDLDCSTHRYQMKQTWKRMGVVMK